MTFAQLAKLGYGSRLIPIVPPKAEISERSTLFKRIQAGDDARGKSPGIRWPDGKWSGFDWRAHQTIESDLPRWEAMGAGAGVKCDDALVAIDADTLNEDIARTIKGIVEKWLGKCPVRIGRYPKALYLVRVSAPYRYARVEFGKANGHPRERVEILSSGKQFVALGVHPVTMEPYRWPLGLPDLAALPLAAPATLDGLIEALKAALPDAGPVAREGVGAEGVEVDQASLRGDLALLRAAVEALPNTTEKFPSRESYLGVGYRIKAALPDDPAMAFELFSGWCGAWRDPNGRSNDPDIVAGDWARMKGPFRRGAESLYRLAQEMSGGTFNAAAIKHHEEVIDQPADAVGSLFGEGKIETPTIWATPFDFAAAYAVGPRQSLYAGHYVRQFLSTTIAPSKVGKTSLIICEALAMATGKPLLGVAPAGPLRVWMWNGEDPLEELQRRIVACMRLYGLTEEDVGDRLFVDTGRKMPIVLATQTKSGAIIAEPVERAMIGTIMKNRIDVVQIDPFISSHRVSENDNNAIDLVAKRWSSIADVTNCAIEIPHHSRKLNGDEVSVEDGRGASALISAVRCSRALARMTKDEADKLGLTEVARRLFRFTEVSSNLSIPAPESQDWMELTSINLNNGVGEDDLDKFTKGDSIGAVRMFDAPDTRRKAMVAAVGADNASREEETLDAIRTAEWRLDKQTSDWIGIPISQVLGIDRMTKEGRGKIRNLIQQWTLDGKLVEFNRVNKARQSKTYVTAAAKIAPLDLFG